MSLSTHVLDAATGTPAVGVAVRLYRCRDIEGEGDVLLTKAATDADGRVREEFPALESGEHRLVFDTGNYFARAGATGFYPRVEISFTVGEPDSHYHVPLLLSPFAYSTYRGS
jgi:5-hydroxyisourate hydrolase